MMTSHSTVSDYFSLSMQIYGKLLGSLDTNICVVALHWHYCTHVLPLKLYLGHDDIFSCKGGLMMHTHIDGCCITEDKASLVDLRGNFGSYVTKQSSWKN